MASALASALVEEDYGGAYINIKYKHAFRIDVCLLHELTISEDEIRFTILEKVNERRKIPIVIEGLSGRNYEMKKVTEVQKCLTEAGCCRFNVKLEPHETKKVVLIKKE